MGSRVFWSALKTTLAVVFAAALLLAAVISMWAWLDFAIERVRGGGSTGNAPEAVRQELLGCYIEWDMGRGLPSEIYVLSRGVAATIPDSAWAPTPRWQLLCVSDSTRTDTFMVGRGEMIYVDHSLVCTDSTTWHTTPEKQSRAGARSAARLKHESTGPRRD